MMTCCTVHHMKEQLDLLNTCVCVDCVSNKYQIDLSSTKQSCITHLGQAPSGQQLRRHVGHCAVGARADGRLHLLRSIDTTGTGLRHFVSRMLLLLKPASRHPILQCLCKCLSK